MRNKFSTKFIPVMISVFVVTFFGEPSISKGENFQKGLNAAIDGDFETAYRFWLPLAERGNARAQSAIAQMYQNGDGVSQDYGRAIKWYILSARQGYKSAQYNLALLYHKGKGVNKNFKKAVKWYRKSAAQGYAAAQSNLGNMYHQGLGLPLSKVYAQMWWIISASNGNADAMHNKNVHSKLLKRSELQEVQNLVKSCVEKFLKDCYVMPSY